MKQTNAVKFLCEEAYKHVLVFTAAGKEVVGAVGVGVGEGHLVESQCRHLQVTRSWIRHNGF